MTIDRIKEYLDEVETLLNHITNIECDRSDEADETTEFMNVEQMINDATQALDEKLNEAWEYVRELEAEEQRLQENIICDVKE